MTKKPSGFGLLPPEERREIARRGGQKVQKKGTGHRFTRKEARLAGQKGGRAVSQDKLWMAEIGRRGGLATAVKIGIVVAALLLCGCQTYTLKGIDLIGVKDGKQDVRHIRCVAPVRIIDHAQTVKKPDGTEYTLQEIAQRCINGRIVK